MEHTVTGTQFVGVCLLKSVIQGNLLDSYSVALYLIAVPAVTLHDWSGREDVNAALNFNDFDLPPWRQDRASGDAFRNFLDVKFGSDFDACRENRLCFCIPSGDATCQAEGIVFTLTFQLHLSVCTVNIIK